MSYNKNKQEVERLENQNAFYKNVILKIIEGEYKFPTNGKLETMATLHYKVDVFTRSETLPLRNEHGNMASKKVQEVIDALINMGNTL